MDLISSLISLAILLIGFFMIYNRLGAISDKLEAQNRYYQSLEVQKSRPLSVVKVDKGTGKSFEELFKPEE